MKDVETRWLFHRCCSLSCFLQTSLLAERWRRGQTWPWDRRCSHCRRNLTLLFHSRSLLSDVSWISGRTEPKRRRSTKVEVKKLQRLENFLTARQRNASSAEIIQNLVFVRVAFFSYEMRKQQCLLVRHNESRLHPKLRRQKTPDRLRPVRGTNVTLNFLCF